MSRTEWPKTKLLKPKTAKLLKAAKVKSERLMRQASAKYKRSNVLADRANALELQADRLSDQGYSVRNAAVQKAAIWEGVPDHEIELLMKW